MEVRPTVCVIRCHGICLLYTSDVYKRQLIGIQMVYDMVNIVKVPVYVRMVMACLLYTSVNHCVRGHGSVGKEEIPFIIILKPSLLHNSGLVHVIPPVSYTHLDVYKRQPYGHSTIYFP